MLEKTCNRCKTTKSHDHFFKDKGKADGYRTICKTCSNRNKEENKVKYAEAQRLRTARLNKTLEGKARLRAIGLKPATKYNYTKNTSKTRGLEFNFTREEYFQVISSTCHYCGDFFKSSGSGLDRVDNSKGYIKGNVVSCCKECNQMKADLSTDQFFVNITKIFARHIIGREEYYE